MTIKVLSIERELNENDAATAIELAEFGKFNIKVAILCGLIFMNTGFSISSVGLVIPSAACDFNLTTLDKGRMSAAPMIGMFLGSYFWGCLADLEGRKIALLLALFSHGLTELISSVISNYWGFVILKFLSGITINGQSTVLFTYLGEFQSTDMREKILCWMEMAWSLGLILLPLVGWAIIPLDISVVTLNCFFHSWNLFVAVCSVPSFFIGLWLLKFPETPNYLAQAGKDAKFAHALELMYSQNTGKSFENYLDKVAKSGAENLNKRLQNVQSLPPDCRQISQTNKSIFILKKIYEQSLTLIKPPYLMRTFIICIIMYSLGSSYYALMLWFPELFQRFGQFEMKYPGELLSVCRISQQLTALNNTIAEISECPTFIKTEVFLHTLTLGGACVPLSMLLPFFVNKLGYKFYLIISSFIAAVVTIGLFFVRSSTQNLILSCIFEAFSSVGASIVLCMIVDLYPTHLRVMAAALCSSFARLGALVGNLLFGYLIDNYCMSLIVIIAVQLSVCSALGFLIPLRRKRQN